MKTTQSERRHAMRRAMIGDTEENVRAYSMSPTYKMWVDTMVDLNLEMSDAMAKGSFAIDERDRNLIKAYSEERVDFGTITIPGGGV